MRGQDGVQASVRIKSAVALSRQSAKDGRTDQVGVEPMLHARCRDDAEHHRRNQNRCQLKRPATHLASQHEADKDISAPTAKNIEMVERIVSGVSC